MEDDEAIRAVLRALTGRSRSSAAKRGIEHSLPDGYSSVLYEKQMRRCDVTGLRFSMQRFATAFVKHPFAPSLDRRDSQGGYTVDNVRLVYASVNFGLGQWGQEVYLRCARAAVEHDSAFLTNSHRLARSQVATSAQPSEALDWHIMMRDRIDSAEVIAVKLTGEELTRQRRHIASLKRNFSLGPLGLTLAADRAAITRAHRAKTGR